MPIKGTQELTTFTSVAFTKSVSFITLALLIKISRPPRILIASLNVTTANDLSLVIFFENCYTIIDSSNMRDKMRFIPTIEIGATRHIAGKKDRAITSKFKV